MIALAHDVLDVGLFTEQLDASLAFWCGDVGLEYLEMVPIGGGVRQHRIGAGRAVVKVNHSRHPLPRAPSTLTGLVVALPGVATARSLTEPDGLPVEVVEAASPEPALTVVVRTPRVDDVCAFWSRLGLAHRVKVERDASARHDGDLRSIGFRFLTVQVCDVYAAHAELVAAGVPELDPPARFGDVAVVSFVADPDGVPIEVSQRASLVGPLPEDPDPPHGSER